MIHFQKQFCDKGKNLSGKSAKTNKKFHISLNFKMYFLLD